jgi:hypothetical protein
MTFSARFLNCFVGKRDGDWAMLHPWNEERLSKEMDDYQQWLDEACELEYQIAEKARSLGKDFTEVVEIPRTSDLADRTEKLLDEYLDGLKIVDELRTLLLELDRESTAIEMSKSVAKRMHARTGDLEKAIEVGLRVGLAILTESVLVAPLEGISNVRLLNNADGSQFVSVDFCGPIRAAGGTAQALAVLITDVVRRELGVGPYIARHEEIERVKEEFGLYRGNLQYRPPPEEIETIVKACPVMVNGESTEAQECAGYGNIENVDGSRVRGGVLLVIGEGLCLKAPKIQKHIKNLEVEGWEFINHFVNKSKSDEEGQSAGFQKRSITPITRFMEDIIAGRPVFGEPLAAGGFRLRYGRTRATGLAAGALSPVTMHAMGEFIAVGTQLKIERPGKACAVTPSDSLQGPTVILNDGRFGRVDILSKWNEIDDDVSSIWDNGEIMLGFGEFLENNKNLIPSAYNRDWWAAELIEALDDEKSLSNFVKALDIDRSQLPDGIPGMISNDDLENFHLKKSWVKHLQTMPLDWDSALRISHQFNCAIPPPWNLNWLDFPIEWLTVLHSIIQEGEIFPAEESPQDSWTNDSTSINWMRLKGGAKNWQQETEDSSTPNDPPGNRIDLPSPLEASYRCGDLHLQHGMLKTSLMLLGLPHHHDGDDIVVTSSWEGLLDGLGLEIKNDNITKRVEMSPHIEDRLQRIEGALKILKTESERCTILEAKRGKVRVQSETAARQRGEGIAATDKAGDEAAAKVLDEGTANPDRLIAAQKLLDDHAVDGILHIIRECSEVRWEHNAPVRIGARMARPEKAACRMKTLVHSLFPVDVQGGPQRLLTVASSRGNLRVSMGPRECTKCSRASPFLRCHHRLVEDDPTSSCNGRTLTIKSSNSNSRRQGEFQTIPLTKILESKIEELGIDKIPKMKCVKVLISKTQTPEPLEKGILRARHNLPVFRDGTVRFDMSDIPVTHFRPCEIGTSWQRLVQLGYGSDVDGKPLESDTQVVELFPQDFIPSTKGIDHLLNTCNFIDELLIRFYKMEPHYNIEDAEGLVGQLGIALAPHTSGGVLCRIIGFTDASGGYAHTLFHAAKRRNCDGDEDCIMLLLDGLLNFSKEILPANRGGRMDAPLVLTTRLNPAELDKEALNVDSAWFYSREFYEATTKMPNPKEVTEIMDFVEKRLGTIGALRGYGYTHDLTSLDAGPSNSAYKILETMVDKLNAQISLAQRLRAVNVEKVASSVVESHFFPDLRGNLLAFTRQKFRCGRCGEKFRRAPLSGKCIKPVKANTGTARITQEGPMQCGGNLIMTVSEGAIRKYVKVANHVMETFGTSNYTQQKYAVLADSLDSLFKNDRVKVYTLDDFL